MNKKVFEKYQQAGEIHKKGVKLAKTLINPGVSLLDVANEVEEFVKEQGAGMAFPLNISLNEHAAHYTPEKHTETVFKKEDLVTIDLGVQVDGYIADSAFTLSLNKDPEHLKLIEAAEKAVENAIEVVKPGVNVEVIGETIENTITGYGFKPVVNLTGHTVDQYTQHGGFSIPNVKRAGGMIEEGMAIAIEPFATNGEGVVYDLNDVQIYQFIEQKPTRFPEARTILKMAEEDFNSMPFATRWIPDSISPLKMKMAMKELVGVGALHAYPILSEHGGGLVAQAEHTMVVEEDGVSVTTL